MTTETPPLTALSLTHVQFDASDKIAYLFAYITLAPIFIVVGYVTTILARREITTINMFIGQIACEALNGVLKSLMKEKRPTDKLGKGYGMPSNHAQFIGFFTMFSVLYLYRRIKFQQNAWKHLIALGLLGFAGAVSCSRVYLNYHTPKQVLVGIAFGATFAIMWYFFIEHILRPRQLFKVIVDSPIAKFFYLRDSANIQDVVRFEYLNWVAFENELKKRGEKDDGGMKID
ncbi:6812_t:CDS:2 [Ambispora leptoticha]|uniref:Dolichyldiphosphatase n=1 Tax=Ambispora leptoticha TaxID=144679 RepID=A0A9N8W850_9GLOM|nr:6812_t:CDS:2 [Ambispora leptoticha]